MHRLNAVRKVGGAATCVGVFAEEAGVICCRCDVLRVVRACKCDGVFGTVAHVCEVGPCVLGASDRWPEMSLPDGSVGSVACASCSMASIDCL